MIRHTGLTTSVASLTGVLNAVGFKLTDDGWLVFGSGHRVHLLCEDAAYFHHGVWQVMHETLWKRSPFTPKGLVRWVNELQIICNRCYN